MNNREESKEEKKKPSVLLRTYGCQMNEYDSELVISILTDAGFVFVDNELDADIVMLNTCSVRENAHRKVYGRIHEIRHLRGHDDPAIIGILGCMSTSLQEKLLDDHHLKIDFIAGPDSYKKLPAIIHQALTNQGNPHKQKTPKPFDISLTEGETYSEIYPTRVDGANAWIAIMRGCNNFCSYCIVPYTRGRERSRELASIIEEVSRLVADGYPQVTLLGQNVNSYTHDGTDFAGLLNAISEIEGLKRIRFTSPHPKDFADNLIEVLAQNQKVCKHIHLPLQAGNTRVLEMMNRGYSKEQFLTLAQKIRTAVPKISISTDIIVGFPTETAQEFEDTVDVMRQVEFDAAFIFKYSPRSGTQADREYPDDIAESEKTRRIVMLNKHQKENALKRNQALIGTQQEILIEMLHADSNTAKGHTSCNKLVSIPNQNYTIGQFVQTTILEASPHNLKAHVK